MKTIEMKAGNKTVSFTTKSVTMDGIEYLYGKMSGIKHSAEKHIYAFKYNGEYKYIPYDPKYAKVIGAIFKQIDQLDKKRQAAAKAAAQAAPVAPAPAPAPAPEAAAAPATEVPAAQTPAETVPQEAPATETPAVAETTEAPAVKTVADVPGAVSVDEPPFEISLEDKALKKSKLKKSLIIFIVVIAVLGVLTAGYFALFGTSSNPTLGPNSNESQQYDNIDELIEDLD